MAGECGLRGGENANGLLNDVWSTNDGVTWIRADDVPWSTRGLPQVAVYGGKLWMVGGTTAREEYKTRWNSSGVEATNGWRTERPLCVTAWAVSDKYNTPYDELLKGRVAPYEQFDTVSTESLDKKDVWYAECAK